MATNRSENTSTSRYDRFWSSSAFTPPIPATVAHARLPEFSRAERFDGEFFVDLPGRDQKDGIWDIYQQHYGLDPRQPKPDDAQWTGAEIKSCCRLATLLDVPLVQAAQNVVPVAVTAGDKIESLRQWASGRCLSADRAGVYSRTELGSGRGRRVMREPGVD